MKRNYKAQLIICISAFVLGLPMFYKHTPIELAIILNASDQWEDYVYKILGTILIAIGVDALIYLHKHKGGKT